MPERARAEHRREQARRHEAHPERGGEEEHLVGLVGRSDGGPGPRDRVGLEQSHALDVIDGGGVDASQRSCIRDAIGRRELRGMDGAQVEWVLGDAEGAVQEQGPPTQGVRSHELLHQCPDRRIFRRRRRHHSRHPPLLLLGQADPELGADRRHHLIGDEAAQAAPLRVHPADELTGQPAVGEGVVAVAGARRPQRGLGLESLHHRVPVEGLVERELTVDRRHAGLVRQQLRHRHALLASRPELGPDVSDEGVIVEQTSLHAQRDRDGGDALGGGEHQLQRVVVVPVLAASVE